MLSGMAKTPPSNWFAAKPVAVYSEALRLEWLSPAPPVAQVPQVQADWGPQRRYPEPEAPLLEQVPLKVELETEPER